MIPIKCQFQEDESHIIDMLFAVKMKAVAAIPRENEKLPFSCGASGSDASDVSRSTWLLWAGEAHCHCISPIKWVLGGNRGLSNCFERI